MIVPTTILSLVALSAAESNSFGKRGLRKSPTPWTAIAVISGVAVAGLVGGGIIGWLIKPTEDNPEFDMNPAIEQTWGLGQRFTLSNTKAKGDDDWSTIDYTRAICESNECYRVTNKSTNIGRPTCRVSRPCHADRCHILSAGNGNTGGSPDCSISFEDKATVTVPNSDCNRATGKCLICPYGVQCKMTGCMDYNFPDRNEGYYQDSADTCASCGPNTTKTAAPFIKGTDKDGDGKLIWNTAANKDSKAQEALCGCQEGFWLEKLPGDGAKSAAKCTACNNAGTTTGAKYFPSAKQSQTDCNMCKENHYQNSLTTCLKCPGAKDAKAAAELIKGTKAKGAWDSDKDTEAQLALCVAPK